MFSTSYSRGMTNIQDPYYNNVVTLLHMNGSNNSTSFTDSSKDALTVTVTGTAKMSTSQNKYGGSSLTQDSNDTDSTINNHISVPATNLGFGAGDFTVEAWYLKTTSFTTHVRIWFCQNHVSGGNRINFLILKTGVLYCDRFGLVVAQSAALTWNNNQWYHVACTRDGSTVRLWRDGVQVASSTNTNSFASDTSYRISPSNSGHFIDEVRITKGVSRYKIPFSPPATQFLP